MYTQPPALDGPSPWNKGGKIKGLSFGHRKPQGKHNTPNCICASTHARIQTNKAKSTTARPIKRGVVVVVVVGFECLGSRHLAVEGAHLGSLAAGERNPGCPIFHLPVRGAVAPGPPPFRAPPARSSRAFTTPTSPQGQRGPLPVCPSLQGSPFSGDARSQQEEEQGKRKKSLPQSLRLPPPHSRSRTRRKREREERNKRLHVVLY